METDLIPAVRVLPVADLMREDRGWTRGHATCSFDDVPPTAPGFLAYGPLRLAALQVIDAGAGYPLHPHAEVETITIMLAGSLAHADTLGAPQVTGPDDVAVLSAGTGLQHAEMVHGDAPARAVLFWLRSEPAGQAPRFASRKYERGARRNRLTALASGRDELGALPVRNDASILAAVLDPNIAVTHVIAPRRRVYLLATDAAVEVNGRRAEAGDRVLADGPGPLSIRAIDTTTEVVLVDLGA